MVKNFFKRWSSRFRDLHMDCRGCVWNDPNQAARSASTLKRRKDGNDPKYPNLPMDRPDGQWNVCHNLWAVDNFGLTNAYVLLFSTLFGYC